MLVANTLDIVLAKAVAQQGRTFTGLDRDDAGTVLLFEVIAGCQCPSRTRGGDKRRQAEGRSLRPQCLEDTRQCGSSASIMSDVVSKLGELIEDDIGRIAFELRAFIVDFFDVAFRSGGPNDILWPAHPAPQPLEPFLAHPRWQDGDATAAKDP